MHRKLLGVVAPALFGCGAASDPGYSSSPIYAGTESRTLESSSPEAPRETVVALQACVDRYALRLSAESYAVMFDIETTGSGGIIAVKVKDSMVAGSDLEGCLSSALERMDVPDATMSAAQYVSPQSRSMVGIVQAAAAPIAMLPIVLVAGGVTILVGVTIYVATDVIDAARRRPPPNKNRCLDAAAGGTYMWREFCNSLPKAIDRLECWSRDLQSEENKRGWCNWRW